MGVVPQRPLEAPQGGPLSPLLANLLWTRWTGTGAQASQLGALRRR